eukprot:CAMPEP_0181105228 /NCGR_PEP_ID=MMETSP1071-20121207/15866_1 /TAXON_ID=35127 /ORGANISM="Thalassiosira sp., Strain NH16" /LENGTH=97 /DNA_ID=CAMNT_0023188513 /DNA_START=183 /DNA_END=473 /DNA_ORIENTATION=+
MPSLSPNTNRSPKVDIIAVVGHSPPVPSSARRGSSSSSAAARPSPIPSGRSSSRSPIPPPPQTSSSSSSGARYSYYSPTQIPTDNDVTARRVGSSSQ